MKPLPHAHAHAHARAAAVVMRCPRCRYDLSPTLRAGFSRCPECGSPATDAVPTSPHTTPAAPLTLIAPGLAAPTIAIAIAEALAPTIAPNQPTGLIDLAAALAAAPLCFVAAWHLEQRFGSHEAPSFNASLIAFAALLANAVALTLAIFARAALA